MCIYKLDDIVNEYNNWYHGKIDMKPVDVKNNTYIGFKKELNDKDSKFKVGDRVRTFKYKNIFAKWYAPNWSEKNLYFKKLKIQSLGLTLLMISLMKKLLKHFMKKNYKRLINKY